MTRRQPTLFATGPTARPTDPATSLQAPTGDTLTRLQAVVMDTHRAHPDGLTDQELRRPPPDAERREPRQAPNRAGAGGPRVRHRDDAHHSGRAAIVWRVTP